MTFWFPQHLARFYIPLPDPLPLVDRYTYILNTTRYLKSIAAMRTSDTAIEVKSNAWMAELGEHMAVRGLDVGDQPAATQGTIPDVENTIATMETFDDNVRTQAFLAMVRIWRGSDPEQPVPEFDRVFTIQKWSEALTNDPGDLGSVEGGLKEVQEYSLAEVVVPAPFIEEGESGLSKTFDNALLAIRHVLESMYLVRQTPLREPTKETLPQMLPCEVGKVDPSQTSRGFPVGGWSSLMFMLHTNFLKSARPPEFTPDEYHALSHTFDENLAESIFVTLMRQRRRARIALYRQGDYAASVVWTAASAESFLTELLQHLMWEQGRTPEGCVADFKRVAISRLVDTQFASRLGQGWDPESGAVKDWKDQVADVRNRVVHDSYVPTFAEAMRADECTIALIKHTGDLLAKKLAVFPRTAFHLMTENGLRERKVYTEWQKHSNRIWGPDWKSTFLRWRRAHDRILRTPQDPDESRGQLLFVLG